MGVQVLFRDDLALMLDEIHEYIKNFWLNAYWHTRLAQFVTSGIKFIVMKKIDHYGFLKLKISVKILRLSYRELMIKAISDLMLL